MEEFNLIPRSGTFADVANTIDENFGLVQEALERLTYSREGFCGMYDTYAALVAAYPNPTAGSFAYVGDAFPMTTYKVDGSGNWYDSDQEYDGGEIDLTNYARSANLEAVEDEVDALIEAGFVFAGVATPTGTPVTSDGVKKFYLAWTAGTYTSYNNYVVSAGELHVFTFNGSSTWTDTKLDIVAKSVVGGYDTEPTEDSGKPITSGGVYDALAALEQTIGGEVLNEVNVTGLDNLTNVDNSKAGSLTRYTVVATKSSNTFKVGTLDVISDKDGDVLTQILTTHYSFANGELHTNIANASYVRQYYRTNALSSGQFNPSNWTLWKPMNDAYLDSLHSTISHETDDAIDSAISTAFSNNIKGTESIIDNIVYL